MPTQAGQGGMRVDCEHRSACGHNSLYHCRMYCDWWRQCEHLSSRTVAARKRRQQKQDEWLQEQKERRLAMRYEELRKGDE